MRTSTLLAAIGAICVPMLSADLAQAQATRTWVSGVGDDANPCSRTAPCKTFAGAISKTAANGIINCLDPGGFGAVTITKSITLECAGTFAGVLASGTNGININAAGIVVTLRNLSIEGIGTGLVGVNITNAATVHIENCHINGFRSGTAAGVRIATTGAVELNVSNSTIDDNGSSTNIGGGILVVPTGAAGSALVNLKNVQLANNSIGLAADGTGSTATNGIRVNMTDSVATGNAGAGISAKSTAAGATTAFMLNNIVVTNNANGGLLADSSKASMLVGSSVITQNLGANAIIATNSAVINTFGNNQFNNNLGGQGAFSNAGSPTALQ